jgi:hypothetical protein
LVRTLWTEEQTSALEADVLSALEAEFGRAVEREPEEPLQYPVGWRDDEYDQAIVQSYPTETLPNYVAHDRLEIHCCKGCGQRTAWRPSWGLCACNATCKKLLAAKDAKRAREAVEERMRKAAEDRRREEQRHGERRRENERYRKEGYFSAACAEVGQKPPSRYAYLVPDSEELRKIVERIQRQFVEQHDVYTIFLSSSLVRMNSGDLVQKDWNVLEFVVTNGKGGTLHVILNGSGPGRAAWTLGAVSAEQAVRRAVGFA